MKEKILRLRSEGKTYNEIQKELNCAKSTISYHCSINGKENKEKHNVKLINNVRKHNQCSFCGSKILKYGSQFCSTDCSNKSRSIAETEEQKNKRLERERLDELFKDYRGVEKQIKIKNFKLLSADYKDLKFESLRARIILEQDSCCGNCNISEWYGNKITLELDHIDGNNKNNNRENLICLCPNCHSITPTWRGRNKKNSKLVDEDYINAFLKSKNVREALIDLGIAAKGNNYKRIYSILDKNNIEY